MGGLFGYSYIDALGHPVARRITTAVVGTSPVRGPFVTAFENTANKGLVLKSYPAQAAAENALGKQQVYLALVFCADKPTAASPALLPEPFSFLTRALPSGATVSLLRVAAYFPDASGHGCRGCSRLSERVVPPPAAPP
jgi:hypothetical protein